MSKTISVSRILQIILFAHLLLLFRIWQISYLSQNQYEAFAHQPRKRVIVDKPQRGAIYDRKGKALALNRICYNAAIYYRDLRQIPAIEWEKGEKRYPRKEYVTRLSNLLAEELEMEASRIEDLIYAKAALFPHLPFTIKENISEKQYYRLRALEKDWLGLHAEKGASRYYPNGKTGCDLLGYVGSINQREYLALAEEIKSLHAAAINDDLPIPHPYHSLEEVVSRLRELKEKAYTVSDRIGKSGIEASMEKELRGYVGISNYEINKKGTFLKKLPQGKEAVPGADCTTTLSYELQAFAEQLLIESETERDPLIPVSWRRTKGLPQKAPWIRGASIVAMDPNNGEVLAMASYPRFDPNDFSSGRGKSIELHKWLETPNYVAAIWDGLAPLTREVLHNGQILEEKKELSWQEYLETIFSPGHPLIDWLQLLSIREGAKLQEDFERAIYLAEPKDPLKILSALLQDEEDIIFHNEEEVDSIAEQWRALLTFKVDIRDLLFAFDLIRLCMDSPLFSDELLQEIGDLTLGQYFQLRQKAIKASCHLQDQMAPHFEKMVFSNWRKRDQKAFLKKKRAEEKAMKRAPRPYIDYIDAERNRQYAKFWKEQGRELLTYFLERAPNRYFPEEEEYSSLLALSHYLGPSLFSDFLRTIKRHKELDKPLYCKDIISCKEQKDLASAFYPKHGFGYSKSYAFQEACVLGSIFKLVTAYAALEHGKGADTFSMVDQVRWDQKLDSFIVGYDTKGSPYPRYFKGGRLPKSSRKNIGKVDLTEALATSSNPFFSLIAAQDYPNSANSLRDAAALFGFGEKTGIDLPREIKGHLPDDLEKNKTGLYSFAIGQHTLIATPIQTACMLSSLCEGNLFKPKIFQSIQGTTRDMAYPLLTNDHSPLKREALLLGIPFTPITKSYYRQQEKVETFPSQIKREIYLSPKTKQLLFQGMDQTIWGKKGTGRPAILKQVMQDPFLQKTYDSLQHQIIGKTSTSEIMQKTSFEPSASAERYKDVWFGAISFAEERPELVVVVYLRYANYGKEAAPYAVKMVKKYRELKKQNKL